MPQSDLRMKGWMLSKWMWEQSYRWSTFAS
jgi:hypothetical protein